MKHLLSLCCLCLLGLARAQLPATYDPAFDARERERISAEREQAVQRYSGEEADCYQRFAVNDCLRDVRRQRRVALEELRRQEILLNDAQRAAIAAEQQRRIEQRQAERESSASQAERDAAAKEQAARVQEAQRRQAERAAVPPAGPGAVPSTPNTGAAAAAARRAEQQKAYEERQRRAEERRQEYERRQSQQGPRNSKPLPVPP
jgi:colicin import membrane protein